jgi:hypothetical protein
VRQKDDEFDVLWALQQDSFLKKSKDERKEGRKGKNQSIQGH